MYHRRNVCVYMNVENHVLRETLLFIRTWKILHCSRDISVLQKGDVCVCMKREIICYRREVCVYMIVEMYYIRDICVYMNVENHVLQERCSCLYERGISLQERIHPTPTEWGNRSHSPRGRLCAANRAGCPQGPGWWCPDARQREAVDSLAPRPSPPARCSMRYVFIRSSWQVMRQRWKEEGCGLGVARGGWVGRDEAREGIIMHSVRLFSRRFWEML